MEEKRIQSAHDIRSECIATSSLGIGEVHFSNFVRVRSGGVTKIYQNRGAIQKMDIVF